MSDGYTYCSLCGSYTPERQSHTCPSGQGSIAPPAPDEGLVEKLIAAYDEAGKRYDLDCDEHSENKENPYILPRPAPKWKDYVIGAWQPLIRAHVEEQVAAVVEECAHWVEASTLVDSQNRELPSFTRLKANMATSIRALRHSAAEAVQRIEQRAAAVERECIKKDLERIGPTCNHPARCFSHIDSDPSKNVCDACRAAAQARLEEAQWHRNEVAGPWPERILDPTLRSILAHQDERIAALKAALKGGGE